MIRSMLRWLTIAWAGLAAATLVLTREAYHVGVGGYTRGDDRHPRQVARRIAALEHAAFPTENQWLCPDCGVRWPR